MKTMSALAGMFFLAMAIPAVAQVPTSPRHVGKARYVYPGEESPVSILSRLLKEGNWQRLEHYGQELITTLGNSEKITSLLGDTRRNYYSLVWADAGDDGKPVVRRLLVHQGLSPQHAMQLPGLKSTWPADAGTTPESSPPAARGITSGGARQMLDVYLTDARSASLTSTYVLTPVENPLTAQLPDVVAKLNVLGFLGSALGTAAAEAPSILIYVNQPDVPMSRATIQIKDVLSTAISSEQLKNKAQTTLESVQLRQARTSLCANSLASALQKRIDTEANTDACQTGSAACADALKKAVDTTFNEVVPKCAAEAPGAVDPVVAVEAEFAKVVEAGGAQIVRGESALTNEPPTRFTFGLLTGLLIGNTTLGPDRVKVDGNKIVKAPLDRSMTMAVLNIHLRGYDAKWPEVTWAERFHVFVGGVITPDFGVSTGIGLGIVRGLSVNGGAAVLFMNTAKPGETIGEEPKNGNDPFRTRAGVGGFFGLSYAFK